jgi:hypothetical protein
MNCYRWFMMINVEWNLLINHSNTHISMLSLNYTDLTSWRQWSDGNCKGNHPHSWLYHNTYFQAGELFQCSHAAIITDAWALAFARMTGNFHQQWLFHWTVMMQLRSAWICKYTNTSQPPLRIFMYPKWSTVLAQVIFWGFLGDFPSS